MAQDGEATESAKMTLDELLSWIARMCDPNDEDFLREIAVRTSYQLILIIHLVHIRRFFVKEKCNLENGSNNIDGKETSVVINLKGKNNACLDNNIFYLGGYLVFRLSIRWFSGQRRQRLRKLDRSHEWLQQQQQQKRSQWCESGNKWKHRGVEVQRINKVIKAKKKNAYPKQKVL